MRRSLRLRLGLTVTCVLALVLASFSVAIHAVIARALARQLDERLAGDAAAVTGMAEQEGDHAELEYESLPDFEAGSAGGVYQLWLDDGRILARSPSLGDRELARDGAGDDRPRFRAVTLPDGEPGRAIQLRRALRTEDAGAGPAVSAAAPGRGVTVVVARPTAPIAATLQAVRRWLWALCLAALLAGSAAMFTALARGLRPVRNYAAALASLDDRRLDQPPPATQLPAELAPIASKLDRLFARLAESFARERRFTADVAHELRTPLAGLRTILEVAQTRDRPAPAYRTALAEATAVAQQMQTLIDDLLVMTRVDQRQVPVHRQPVPLRALVADCWAPFEVAARERQLRFDNQVAEQAIASSDPQKLRLIVRNLLANAVQYTAPGGTIVARGDGSQPIIDVWDSGPQVPADLLPRVFDRFFRADPARAADGGHAGIGLALVKALGELLDLEVTAENVAAGGISFRLADRMTTRIEQPGGATG